MQFHDPARRLLSSRRVMITAGIIAVAALFLAIWLLLAPHFEVLGGVYRLAANRPQAAPDDAAVVAAVLLAGAAAFSSGALLGRIRGRRSVR
jgi:uncharacterized SAM-binding protein YcdF (DUF218 family)